MSTMIRAALATTCFSGLLRHDPHGWHWPDGPEDAITDCPVDDVRLVVRRRGGQRRVEVPFTLARVFDPFAWMLAAVDAFELEGELEGDLASPCAPDGAESGSRRCIIGVTVILVPLSDWERCLGRVERLPLWHNDDEWPLLMRAHEHGWEG